jgi:hypothetical protein
MSDSLLEDETLTTVHITRPAAVPQTPAAAMDCNSDEPNRTDQPDAQPIPLPAATTNYNPITDAGPLFPDDDLQNFRAGWN